MSETLDTMIKAVSKTHPNFWWRSDKFPASKKDERMKAVKEAFGVGWTFTFES